MTLALEITVKDESSVVEVYDQVFSLEGGIYDRCLKKDASIRWDDKHRIAEIKKQIHQVSREISMWIFENNPEQAAIPKAEYEKLRDKVFEKNEGVDKSLKVSISGKWMKQSIIPRYILIISMKTSGLRSR